LSRCCGSIFISTLIATLSSASTPLVTSASNSAPIFAPNYDQREALEESSLQPAEPDEQQTKTYNAFCHSILETCKERIHRLWNQLGFSFSAQDDLWEYSWTGRTGIPLAHFEQRWNQLATFPYPGSAEARRYRDPDPSNPTFTESAITSRTGGVEEAIDEMTISICQNRTMAMARIFRQTCPGDWNQGPNVALGNCLRECAEGNEDHEYLTEVGWDMAAVIRFRL
jgi:hypothetical protein